MCGKLYINVHFKDNFLSSGGSCDRPLDGRYCNKGSTYIQFNPSINASKKSSTRVFGVAYCSTRLSQSLFRNQSVDNVFSSHTKFGMLSNI